MFQPWYETLSIIVMQTVGEFSVYIPRVLGALVVLLVGAAVSRALKGLLIKVLHSLRLSQAFEKTPVEHFLKNADLSHKLEEVIGSVVYWLLMLIVIQASVGILGLTSLTIVFDRILGYIPHVISAILVLFLGVLLAGLVESLVKGSIRSIDGRSARLLGKLSSYMVVSITVMMAISELGIASEFITILFIGFVATASLGLGLALGLGGKDLVSRILTEWYEKTSKELQE